jgi:hypothetical protein
MDLPAWLAGYSKVNNTVGMEKSTVFLKGFARLEHAGGEANWERGQFASGNRAGIRLLLWCGFLATSVRYPHFRCSGSDMKARVGSSSRRDLRPDPQSGRRV